MLMKRLFGNKHLQIFSSPVQFSYYLTRIHGKMTYFQSNRLALHRSFEWDHSQRTFLRLYSSDITKIKVLALLLIGDARILGINYILQSACVQSTYIMILK